MPGQDIELLWETMGSRDQSQAYAAFFELQALSAESDAVAERFDDMLRMLKAKSSFARVRGFLLLVANARWWDEARAFEAFYARTVLAFVALQHAQPSVHDKLGGKYLCRHMKVFGVERRYRLIASFAGIAQGFLGHFAWLHETRKNNAPSVHFAREQIGVNPARASSGYRNAPSLELGAQGARVTALKRFRCRVQIQVGNRLKRRSGRNVQNAAAFLHERQTNRAQNSQRGAVELNGGFDLGNREIFRAAHFRYSCIVYQPRHLGPVCF